jgi:hypothetical protein
MKEKKKFWYYITVYECVLCGRQEVYRERRYGEKPKDWKDCHDYIQNACSDHF